MSVSYIFPANSFNYFSIVAWPCRHWKYFPTQKPLQFSKMMKIQGCQIGRIKRMVDDFPSKWNEQILRNLRRVRSGVVVKKGYSMDQHFFLTVLTVSHQLFLAIYLSIDGLTLRHEFNQKAPLRSQNTRNIIS